MEGFALRDAGDEARAPLALCPVHLALVAFVATLPAHAPTIGAFAKAPQFEAIADTFLFALLLAAVTSSVVVLLRGLQRPRKVFARARVTAIAAAAYLLGTMGAVGLLFAPMPLPAGSGGRPWAGGFGRGRRCPCWWRNGPEPWPSPSTMPSSCALSSC